MSVPANQIPAHPGVAAQVAAAGPAVRVAQDNNIIPAHPGVMAARAQAMGPQGVPPAAPQQNLGEDFDGDGGDANPQADWFGAAAVGAPTPERHLAPPTLPPEAPPANRVSQQQTQAPSYSEIDALLDGIEVPGEAQAPQQVQGVPQQQQVPQAVPQPQHPQQQTPPPPAAEPPQQYDAEAAQRAAIDQLMGRDYALSEVDQRRLIAEPEAVIPRLAAQVHVNVVRDIGSRIGPIVTALVNQQVEQRLTGIRREQEFFGHYPKLANPAFRSIVEESLALVKASNPNITQEQLFQQGASYAAFQIRSKFRQAQPQNGGFVPRQAATVQPFVPMSPGAPSVPQAPQGGNPFAELANATDLFDW